MHSNKLNVTSNNVSANQSTKKKIENDKKP